MNPPFFSVVMPIYNRESFINLSVLSVLQQDFNDFELICVDDGSTDHSVEAIQRFVEKDKRVKLIRHTENLGRCAARNTGIRKASAKWICFLDSDDQFLSNHLSVFHRLISRFPDQHAFASSIVTDSLSDPKVSINRKEKISIIKLNDVIHTNILPPNVLCYNKEIITITFGNENIPVSEDWLFSRNLLMETEIVKTNIRTVVISSHEERTMNTTGIKEIAFWNEYTGILFSAHPRLTKGKSDLVKSHTYLLCANMLISNGLKNDSMIYFSKSFPFLKTYLNTLFYKYIIKLILK
jgi:glycosyltransferase involved in cell wall biosynthesis